MKKKIVCMVCLILWVSCTAFAEPAETAVPSAAPAVEDTAENSRRDMVPRMPGGAAPGGRMGGSRGSMGMQPPESQVETPVESQVPSGETGVDASGTRNSGMPAGEVPASGRQDTAGEIPPERVMPPGDEMPVEGEMPRMGGGMGRGGRNMNFGDMADETAQEAEPSTFSSFLKTYQTPVIALVLLVAAFVFVIFYKRKQF